MNHSRRQTHPTYDRSAMRFGNSRILFAYFGFAERFSQIASRNTAMSITNNGRFSNQPLLTRLIQTAGMRIPARQPHDMSRLKVNIGVVLG